MDRASDTQLQADKKKSGCSSLEVKLVLINICLCCIHVTVELKMLKNILINVLKLKERLNFRLIYNTLYV